MMTAEKFVGKSRALWAMLLPGLALIFNQTGIGDNVFGQVSTFVEGLLGAGGAVVWLWHYLRPDDRTPTLRPGAGAVVSSIVFLALVGLTLPAMPGCVSLGKKDATVEQQFYEVDGNALTALRLAVNVIREVGPEKLSPKTKAGLLGAKDSLGVIRTETKAWVDACTGIEECDAAEKIALGVDSMISLTALVTKLVVDARAEGSTDGG